MRIYHLYLTPVRFSQLVGCYLQFRMDKDKEEYFKDLQDILQTLKLQVQKEEERNAKVIFDTSCT